MSTSAAESLEWLFRPPAEDSGIDRKALAGLLVELARNLEPGSCAEANGVSPLDPRLEELRGLVLGREIEGLARLSAVVEDPEQLAVAVGRVLPSAIASSDARLGQVLAPALEKATQSSIRNDPRTLLNIIYPLIVPAIRKSIGEAIDKTFQSLNESLKHSLSWRGLRWRFEAWRTGTSFAEVVLKHTLVYQVEHVFLIHQHTGLLIAHVAAENAASQDPQLVSSMLAAIQDFVRDSFKGAEQQGVDTLRLGDFRLWCEPGPLAMLVAVIRGNPPEELRETLRSTLAKIHSERRQALESFDGDSSGLADVEAHLAECAALHQRAATRWGQRGFPWLVAGLAALLFVLVAGAGFHWWLKEREWEHQQQLLAQELAQKRQHELQLWMGYVDKLRSEPGIVVTEAKADQHDNRFAVAGLRDPLAVDPQAVLRQSGVEPARVDMHWQPYQSLDPQFVLQRLKASLDPPPSVTLALAGNNIIAHGSAGSLWLGRARAAARMLPAGGPVLDLSGVRDVAEGALAKLRKEIENHEIYFKTGDPLPAPGQDTTLDQLAAELKDLAALSSNMRVATHVTLTGHSDDTGPGTLNLSLSMARAGAVVVALKKRGVDSDLMSVHGAGPLEPAETGSTESARDANRRVSVGVWFEDQQ